MYSVELNPKFDLAVQSICLLIIVSTLYLRYQLMSNSVLNLSSQRRFDLDLKIVT